LERRPTGNTRRTVSTIAATGAAEARALELVVDDVRTDWREHVAVRIVYGLACAIVAVLIPGEWKRLCS
jgi:hypothetical protein